MTICLAAASFFTLATGCVEEVPEVIEEMHLSNVLTPGSTSAVVSTSDGCTVTFTWTNSNTATQYLLQVYRFETDSAPASAEEVTDEMLSGMTPEEHVVEPSETGSSTSVSIALDREYSFYARVCGQNTADDTQGDSKWAAFPYPIDTYTVMDPLRSVTVTDRTDATITVAWELEEGDADGVNQIRVSPSPDSETEAYKVYTIGSGVTEMTLDGLKASTRYTVAMHFNSANRGTVYAWTRPSLGDAVTVSDTTAFKQALREAANWTNPPLKIQVAYNGGVAYEMGAMDILGPVEIYGEQTVEGASPVIIGYFNMRSPGITYTYMDYTEPTAPVEQSIPDILGATSLRAEALSFSGNGYELGRNITFAENFPSESPVSVSIVNCEMSEYSNGMFYDNSKTVNFTSIEYESVYVHDISGDGGDNFDVRAANTINSITVRNSTFSDGMRTFLRIDAPATVHALTFRNNTFNSLCGIDNSNNKGLFNIRGTVDSAFEIRDNIFLNMNGCETRTCMFPAQATAFPTSVAGNYYYNFSSQFFYDSESSSGNCAADEFPQSTAIAGGGAVLTSDPCYNSERGIFNVTNTTVLNAGAGDPRWLSDYVEQPDPDLVPVEYGYTWTLNDTDTFYDVIDESCVRGNTRFIVTSNPINVTEEGFEFTAAPASFEYSGVPTDCAMAFLVDGPGSVVLSTLEDGSSNDHITVAYGPADGTSLNVAGAVYAGATRSRAVLADIPEGGQQLVYIYACGPIVLSELSWIEDTSTAGSTPLDTPANVSVSAPEATEGTVTLSWDAVSSAASYMIRWTGPLPTQEDSLSVTGNSHDFTVADLATGIYNFSVRADVSETDVAHEASEFSEAVKFIRRETLSNVSAATPTTWGLEDFTFMQALIGSDQNTDPAEIWGDSFVYNNLEYYAGNTIRFATSDGLACFQYPGSSNNPPNRRYLRFLASGNGTVTVTLDATSSGRNLYVSVAGTSGPAHEAPNTSDDGVERGTFSETVTANAGDEIILWADASLRVFEITWTPAGYDPDDTIPSDPLAVEEQKDVIDYLRTTYGTSGTTALVAAGADPVTIDKITYAGKSNKSVDWDGGSERIKLQGASEVGDDGIPTSNYISFKVTKPGTIKHYLRSGSSSDTGRTVKIDLVMNDGADIVNLYEAAAPTGGYSSNEVSTQITSEQLAQTRQTATVYIYAPVNSVNVYYLEYIPD